MTIRGTDAAVDALRDRLEDDLPAAITAINAEALVVADGYTIENPLQVLDYVPPLDHLNQFPTVCIAHGPGRFEDDNAWHATGIYELAVVAVLQDADQQALTRRMRRYVTALQRVVLEDRNLGSGTGIPWSMTLKTIHFGDALGDMDGLADDAPPRAYLTWAAVVVEVKLDEE